MVTYGDGVADIDINKLLSFHRAHGKTATMTAVSPTSQFGELILKGESVSQFREKPRHVAQHYVSGGFYVFNRSFFDLIDPRDDYDLEADILEGLAAKGELMAYKHSGDWACMDTLRDMEYLNRLWDEDKAFWKIWK
jgi:glucose-1-phosphate cytidylyltransferase